MLKTVLMIMSLAVSLTSLGSEIIGTQIIDPIEGIVPNYTIGEHKGGYWHEEELEPMEHEEIYEQVVEWQEESEIVLENNLKICIEDKCHIYDMHNDSGRELFAISVPKKAKKSSTGKGAEAVQSLLKGLSKGVSAGGRLRVKSLKVNTDGSFTIDGLDIQFGVAAGTDAPVPGMEDGKQTHRL